MYSPHRPAIAADARWISTPPRAATFALALMPFLLLACAGEPGESPAGEATDASSEPPAPEIPLPERSNILLITIDTLRADHLSTYGYGRETSPRIDVLAAEGVRFDRPAVQWPKTGPSFASMLTSTYPKDTGIVRHIGIPVPREMTMLTEVLAEIGYATRAVVANGALSREFNYDQGFETYVESWRNPPEEKGLDPDGATRVTDLAIGLARELEAQRAEDDRPYFLWVHYLDPHFPYEAPEPWTDRFADDGLYDPGRTLEIDLDTPHRQMLAIGYRQVLGGRDDLAYYIARYDAEIAYVDSEVGRLLDSVTAMGLLENTLTVLTSDHGESLGDHHYYFDHGRFGWQTCLRVPLILHFPGVLEPAVDPRPAALIHLAPTLLEFAGVELEDGRWSRGRSLVPRLFGATDPMVVAFSEAGHEGNKRWQRVVQNRRYKLIYARARQANRWIGGVDVPWALYDLEEDPEETVNVIDEHPEVYRHLRGLLTEWLDSGPQGAEKSAEEADAMDPETLEQLRALGYIE